jgi:hypothetical protein
MILTGDIRSNGRKARPSATLSVTIRTLTDVESNMDHRAEKPLTNGLSHGAAI